VTGFAGLFPGVQVEIFAQALPIASSASAMVIWRPLQVGALVKQVAGSRATRALAGEEIGVARTVPVRARRETGVMNFIII